MRAIRLKISPESDVTTLDVGHTIRAGQIPENISGTLIDPVILKKGTRINFPKGVLAQDVFGRVISHVIVPSLSPDGRIEKSGEMVFLHPVTVASNQILSYFEQNEGNIQSNVLSRLVKLQYWSLIDRVVGHRGVIATNISGTRMAHSGRLVLIPQIDRSPEWVGLSSRAMKSTDIKEGDLIIIFRDPVIWTGSMEVVKAYPLEGDVIALHPLLFKQMGADCDGDQVAFVKPPNEPGVSEEMQANLIRHARKFAKWPKYLCHSNLPEEPDWENIVEDTKRRFVVTGQSYGPGEVRGWTKLPSSVEELEIITGKPGRGMRNKEISCDPEVRKKILLDTNYANLFMKGYLGVVGATARRILLVMGEDPWLNLAANRCSETIQQSTLDTKHQVDMTKAVSPIDIMEMFERRGAWTNSSIENCIELLVKADISPEDARRLITHFRVEIPVLLFVEVNLPKKKTAYADLIRSCVMDEQGNALTKLNLVPVLDKICTDMSKKLKTNLTVNDVFKEIQDKYMLGLSDLIDRFYPGYAITHKSTSKDMDKAVALFKTVFHDGRKDRSWIFRHLWEG